MRRASSQGWKSAAANSVLQEDDIHVLAITCPVRVTVQHGFLRSRAPIPHPETSRHLQPFSENFKIIFVYLTAGWKRYAVDPLQEMCVGCRELPFQACWAFMEGLKQDTRYAGGWCSPHCLGEGRKWLDSASCGIALPIHKLCNRALEDFSNWILAAWPPWEETASMYRQKWLL